MNILWRLMLGALATVGVVVVVFHHVAYFHRRRPYSFAAFLETAGWIVVTLAAIAAFGGGLPSSETRAVEIAAAIVGALLIGIGSQFK